MVQEGDLWPMEQRQLPPDNALVEAAGDEVVRGAGHRLVLISVPTRLHDWAGPKHHCWIKQNPQMANILLLVRVGVTPSRTE